MVPTERQWKVEILWTSVDGGLYVLLWWLEINVDY
jgi:hypothetical protein